jgi:hypothetical protein
MQWALLSESAANHHVQKQMTAPPSLSIVMGHRVQPIAQNKSRTASRVRPIAESGSPSNALLSSIGIEILRVPAVSIQIFRVPAVGIQTVPVRPAQATTLNQPHSTDLIQLILFNPPHSINLTSNQPGRHFQSS